MITGAAQMDGAILVVAATDGPMPQTKSTSSWPARSASPTSSSRSTRPTWSTTRRSWSSSSPRSASCSASTSSRATTSVVRVSALKALEGDKEWGDKLMELMDAVDTAIPEPEREIDKPFLMPVEDVFTITGRGTVVTADVERGIVKVSEEIEIVGIRENSTKTTVTGVEMFRKLLDQGQAGDNVGLLLRGIKREDVERARSSSSRLDHPAHELRGLGLHPLEGRGWPSHAVLQQLPSPVLLPDDGRHWRGHAARGTEMVMPGDNTEMTVELIQPIAMEEGLRFAIREGGRTVGAGRVVKIVK